ncbi:MAG TPA: MFS transporter [Hypericibacter adhaerens]|jgi:PAT family beta-lactamase induction signal transducer AmpG|uniref:MFS transporter n=1 Tax=Hypericibacter adhaerens TaxID=2602016 RepID=A0A5J6N804_9PROT|nr:MFS transporter [Hypericibacter adhaerens]QEX25010.1 MFS transporter [Hypericibacter adhaerens]HWA45149.1 MFS transporter [Hypericibacter adhaerens]
MNSVTARPAPGRRNWQDTLKVYLDRRMLVILLMGFSSGLPLLLTLSTLSYWLKKVGVDLTTIGLFALVGVPYSFKFVWAPLVDQLRLPLLTRWLGRRRGWAFLAQACLIGAILFMGATDPAIDPWWTALAALLVAFFSATQDIAIDAYRIEILTEEEQGAGAAATQAGYRLGLILAGAGALAASDFIGWPVIFAGLAAAVGIGMIAVLLAPEPVPPEGWRKLDRAPLFQQIKQSVWDPFAEFLFRPGALVVLAFVLLYKFGDAIGGTMANPFYAEMGFTGTEIAAISKVFGVIMTLVGVAAGGLLVARYGLFRALVLGGVLQAVTNLLYAWVAVEGHSLTALTVTIGADNLANGVGSAAFVAYLSALCNVAFTGTQYALLTSFMAAGRTMLSSGSGWLAAQLGWAPFFIATAFLAVPGLLLLFWLMRLYPAQAKPLPSSP